MFVTDFLSCRTPGPNGQMCGGGERSHSGILASNQHNADIKADPAPTAAVYLSGELPSHPPLLHKQALQCLKATIPRHLSLVRPDLGLIASSHNRGFVGPLVIAGSSPSNASNAPIPQDAPLPKSLNHSKDAVDRAVFSTHRKRRFREADGDVDQKHGQWISSRH